MNLGGIIFHIEEDAYDKLNKYLSTIKGYFKDSEGRDEIMTDIESRIAEMLQEKVSSAKQAVLLSDVESVIAIMGKPEDFAGEGDGSESKINTESSSEENKFSYPNNKRRRVFRDEDNKILGGVCAGISNYFDFDPLWIRAAFAISFFAFGSGFLLYLILWIIIPKAKTTAEKLEMHGEKVDVNNIGKAVNEEFEDFKKRMNDFGDKAKSPETKEKIRTTAQKATEFLGDVFHNMIKVVGKIVAFLLVFIGIALMVGLLATIFGRGTISVFNSPTSNIHFSIYEFSSAVFPADLPVVLVIIALILFFGVPLLSLIYAGIRHLFGIKQKNKIVKYTANSLWLIGLGLVIYIGFQIGNDFSEEATVKQKIEITQPTSQVLYLDLKPMPDDDIDLTYHRKRHNINIGDWTMISKDNNKFSIGYPMMDIVRSETDSFQIVIVKTANGYDKKEAVYHAKNIEYSIAQKDSTIFFNSFFDIMNADKLRAQDVKIIVKVPLNKVIYLSKRMEKVIYNIHNLEDAIDYDMVNRRWIMAEEELRCIDCNGLVTIRKHKIDTTIPTPPIAPVPAEVKK